jgi:hypothetical protein
MVPEMERSLLLQQLKNYLLFLKESGHTQVPLNSELSELPMLATPSGTFPNSSPQLLEPQMTTNPLSKGLKEDSEPSPRLVEVREELGDCQRCKLCETRQTIVFGSGNPNADLVFVGEGPGADEDAQGLPRQ